MEKKNKPSEEKITRMFRRDAVILLLVAVAMCAIIVLVLLQVLALGGGTLTAVLACGVAAITGASMVYGLASVFFHMRKNKEKIYSEELMNR